MVSFSFLYSYFNVNENVNIFYTKVCMTELIMASKSEYALMVLSLLNIFRT